jgi:hypothetical protein
VLYPTLDSAGSNAPILAGCGQYPLIVLTHGQCIGAAQVEHFLEWGRSPLATQLARAGYVVVVPQLPGTGFGNDIVQAVVAWIRNDWDQLQVLAPSLGAIGHSHGNNQAGFLATDGGADALVLLSEVWLTEPPPINIPSLHVRGGNDATLVGNSYPRAARPKHRVFIDGAMHYDYLSDTPCQTGRGPCGCTPGIVADVVTMFLGRYLPQIDGLPQRIPPLLVPPPLNLTNEQSQYAGDYLSRSQCTNLAVDGCSVTLEFELDSIGESETIQWSSNVMDHRST